MTFTLLHAFLLPALIRASPLLKRDYPPVGACSGKCQGRLHDPAVIYREDTSTYYRFTTNDGLHTATAPSIEGPWTDQGPALPDGSSIDLPGNKDLWAPDLFHYQETYYLYYSVSQIGSKNSSIGVATSPSLDPGSWTDHGSIGIPTSPDYNRIDANLYYPSGGSPVLNFGSFWQNIFQFSMEPSLLKITGEAKHISQNTTTRPAGLVTGAQEGAYLFFWQGYHYLFLSGGNCCNEPGQGSGLAPAGEEYHILVCRSSEASGGFVDRQGRDCLNGNGGTLLLGSQGDVYAPGGQGVMFDPKLKMVVVYYHYVKPSVSYAYDDFFFGWNKLDFEGGWPRVVA
ncbi:Arabinan endo-1,5-alpha-L-arabinosidase A [Fulvia fulva]|uniref:Arabinan endo-1,5-alpha-L-arabinosidase n=1 Tax=Passalora fulva TaxID=5499 RepID=A0A1P8YXU5_PASFU|nr:Arabinan endo-1,5-alpha-L-arabinosidase A [Fulvia fulva]AQA29340.1 hypothetical protein 47 [Fulvia fulva]KAK4620535.1 Arabinan endo-1,5-alpha-L-arabinosidase A [Fulvia fulva]UJO19640.1 Arabinan endo-1,5-alpha-L-arabinosidase A [Fulvia fulva]WPV17676.1 Arabinan endo-1,5-alpha-L-arabinosidase A [Fulvia fulva]WPV32129.1 Arabinan endo-1,5-alpha-L-arabinosidase A [Fulvia fulva]